LIDEIRIWNRSLSTKEIQQLYYSNLQKYDSSNWSFYAESNFSNNFSLKTMGSSNFEFAKFNQTNYEYYINKSADYTNITYNYFVSAIDVDGNENSTGTRNAKFDWASPTITITTPASGGSYTNNFNLNISITDNECNLKAIKYNITSVATGAAMQANETNFSAPYPCSALFSSSVAVGSWAEGNYNLTVEAGDAQSETPPSNMKAKADNNKFSVEYFDSDNGLNIITSLSTFSYLGIFDKILGREDNSVEVAMKDKNFVYNVREENNHYKEGFEIDKLKNREFIKRTIKVNEGFRLDVENSGRGHILVYQEGRFIPFRYISHESDADAGLTITTTQIDSRTVEVVINSGTFGWGKVEHKPEKTVIQSMDTAVLNYAVQSIIFTVDRTPPTLTFVNPTPLNNTRTANLSFEINTTIIEPTANLDEAVFNWNGTNESVINVNSTDFNINFSITSLTSLNWTANNTQLGLYGNDLMLMMNFENRSALGESSSLIVDLSKYGLNGTYNGNAVINATGKYGTAVNFDGSGDDIAFSSSPTGVNTISFWMNSRQSASGCAIVIAGSDVYNSNSWNWGIWMGNGASPLIAFTAKPGVAQGTPPLSLNTWTHVVLVRNSNGNALFYMNGNMTNNISSGSGNTDGVLRIGTAGTYDYNGLIDEIRIWNRSLSTKEIQQLYYSNLQKYDSSNWSFYNTQIPLNNYTFSADGARDNIKFVKFNTTNFDYYMNKSGLGNGDYLYRLFGRDAVGNTSSTEQRTIDIIAATGNNLPTATLLDPAEGNRTNNRKPMFNWSGADADGDAINYTLNISLKASSTCTDTEKIIENITAMNYTLTSDLKCLYDNGDYYLWSIRPYDGEGYGNWTTPRTLNLSSVISLSLPTSTVQFGPIKYTDSNDTTDNSPPPFIIQNNGNAFTNVTIDATSLWRSVENPNNYYKYKIANATGEEGAFHWFSITGFATMPLTGGGSDKAIVRLNYTDATDSAEIDVYVQVPPDEGSNVRNSTVSLTGSLAE
jgi:hypothetical protein